MDDDDCQDFTCVARTDYLLSSLHPSSAHCDWNEFSPKQTKEFAQAGTNTIYQYQVSKCNIYI